MSQSTPPQSSDRPAGAEPTADEPLTLGGRIGLLLLVFFALAVIVIEVGRFIALLLR